MTKKHFEWAAAYVRDIARVLTAKERDAIVRTLVDLFGEFNPRFDESRFRAACQVPAAGDKGGN